MAKQLTPKRKGTGLEIKTFVGESGRTYLVLKTGPGSYHVFAEIDAKEAAVDCGAAKGGYTRTDWKALWERG